MINEKESLITQTDLFELFNYDEITGIVIWKKSRSNRIKLGTKVGSLSKHGYLQVRLNGKLWLLHRLIWLMKTGNFPKLYIDHINGIRSDNSWNNLREVNRNQNMQNIHNSHFDSATGLLGVTFDKQSGKYKAQMTVNGEKVLNKLFNTPDEARECYLRVKEEIKNDK